MKERERRLNFTAHLVVRAQKIAFLSPQLNMRAAETGRSLNNALQMERHSNKYIESVTQFLQLKRHQTKDVKVLWKKRNKRAHVPEVGVQLLISNQIVL